MPLLPLKIIKNWFRNTRTRENNWDEIRDNVVSYTTRNDNNLKQVGLDLNGADYDYNNVGRATQSIPVINRVTTLEGTINSIIPSNIALDISTASVVKIVSSDGSNLSSDNPGKITFNSTTAAGELITRSIEANIEVTLTGCHWGLDTFGDFSDIRLWVGLIDTGSTVRLAVAKEGDRETIATADDETVQSSVNSTEKVLVDTVLTSENNVTWIGWLQANFDDTGNAGGENFWTIQSTAGDVSLQPIQTYFNGEVLF